MRYDLLVSDFINLSVDDVRSTVPLLAPDVEWIDIKALNALGRYRTAIESQVALLSEQMRDFSARTDDLFSGPDFEICLPPVSAEDFRRLFDSGDAVAHESSIEPTEALCSFWFLSGEPDPTGGGFWGPPVEPTVRVVAGHCQHCWFQGGLFSKDVAAGCVSLISTWCPVCGMPGPGRSAYVLPTFGAPLVLLAQIALLETLSRFKILLLLVIAAVAVLLSRLRRAIVRNEIAIRQRSFFTHHGTHPPRIEPSRAPGLLSGMAFQLQVAA